VTRVLSACRIPPCSSFDSTIYCCEAETELNHAHMGGVDGCEDVIKTVITASCLDDDSPDVCTIDDNTFVFGAREYRLGLSSLTYDEAEAHCVANAGELARCGSLCFVFVAQAGFHPSHTAADPTRAGVAASKPTRTTSQ
jgi:hypothetical protein